MSGALLALLNQADVDFSQVVEQLENQKWEDLSSGVTKKLEDKCKLLVSSLRKSKEVSKKPSEYLPFLGVIDTCRFAFSEETLKQIANQLVDTLEGGIKSSDSRLPIDRLSYQFVSVLNPENRQLYNNTVHDPWEALRDANIVPPAKLDVAKLIIPKDADFRSFICKFISHLQLLLESDTFWVGDPWEGIFRKRKFKETVKWKRGTFYVLSAWISEEKKKKKIQFLSSGVESPAVDQKLPMFEPAEQKLEGVPYYSFWHNGSKIVAYDKKVPAMGIWMKQEQFMGEVTLSTANDIFTVVAKENVSLKVTSIDMSELYNTLTFMRDCHAEGCFTGPLFLYTGFDLSIPTPPFSGSLGDTYAVSGPSKINLKPSAESDLILLFTCLAEKEIPEEKKKYWRDQVQRVKNGASVADFIQEIDASI